MMPRQKEIKKNINQGIFIFLFATLFILSLIQLDISPERIGKGLGRGIYILNQMFPPVLAEPLDVVGAALESFQVAVMGTLFGVLISLVLAVFAARNISPHPSISYGIKTFTAFVRAVPALIWAILFIIAVGLGPTPGILALAVNSIGMLVKVYAESIEEMDMGIIDALKSTGANYIQIIIQGVLPTVKGIFVAWSVFRFDINIRYATVLGVVGAGGIGWELMRAARMIRYNEALAITIVIFIMIMATEGVTRYLKSNFENVKIEEAK